MGLTILFQSKSFAATITHDVDAEKAILIDFTSGKTLLEKNADQPITPGSMTKIMTSVIAFDYLQKNKIKLSDKFFVSEKAWRMSQSGYSAMFIMINDKVSVENLLKGIIIVNGNDASVALAEGIAGSEAKFVTLMNKKAKEIGLKKTNFANSTGMSDANNYSTVRDIAKLSAYLIKNYPEYYHYYKETKFTWNRTGGDPITQGNRNPLLYKNIGVDGLKTSFTTREGYALASSIKFRDKRLIAVGIGFKSKNARSRESIKLLYWGKINYAKFDIPKKEPTQTQQVAKKEKKVIKKEEKKVVKVAETIIVGNLPSANIFDTYNYKHRIFFEFEKKTYNAFTSKKEKTEQFFLWFNEFENGKAGNYIYEFIMSMNNPVNVFKKANNLGESLEISHWNNYKTEKGNKFGDLYKTIAYETKDFSYNQYINKDHQVSYGALNKITKKWDAYTSFGQDWLLNKGLGTQTGKTLDEQRELIKKAQLLTKDYEEVEQKIIKIKNKYLKEINLKKSNLINSATPTNIAGINILDNIKFYLKKENINEDLHVREKIINNKKVIVYKNMINTDRKKIIDINIDNNYFDNVTVVVDENQIINNISFFKYLGTNRLYPDEDLCINERDNFIDNLNIKNINFYKDYLYQEKNNRRAYQDIKYNDFEYKNKNLRFEIVCFNDLIHNEEIEKNKEIHYIFGISLSDIENLNDAYIENEVKRISNFTIDDVINNNYKIIDQIALTALQDEIAISKKQEKYKPEKKLIDSDPPKFEIVENITITDQAYKIEGKIIDNSKIYLEINGRPVTVKSNGKFVFEGFVVDAEKGERLELVAIDEWKNKSEPVTVEIKVNLEETIIAKTYEQLFPNRVKGYPDNNKVAIIIGIEKYDQSPNATYANIDAKYFFEYTRRAFGVKKQNINLLIDNDASLTKTYSALSKWLPSKIISNQTDLIVFFAGHGLASSDGKELYLLLQDSDPDLLSLTALSRTKLFQTIVDLKPKSVTMFLDTCYSGISRDEQMLLASARPIRIVASDEGEIPNNFTIFSASQLDQISSGLKEAKHGIFSYYLMKGLEGNADTNKNKEITNGELLAYMDINVSQKALELGRQQNPSLAGDPDQVLMKY